MKRTKTLPGLWSGNKAFHAALKKVFTCAKEQSKATGEFWDFGPAEWRHCFGTALGHCRFSALQISFYMGNSEDIARRHYIAPPGAKPWTFDWNMNPLAPDAAPDGSERKGILVK